MVVAMFLKAEDIVQVPERRGVLGDPPWVPGGGPGAGSRWLGLRLGCLLVGFSGLSVSLSEAGAGLGNLYLCGEDIN